MDKLKGYKTYLLMGGVFVLGGLKAMEVIDDAIYAGLVGMLAPAGVMALRAGMKSE